MHSMQGQGESIRHFHFHTLKHTLTHTLFMLKSWHFIHIVLSTYYICISYTYSFIHSHSVQFHLIFLFIYLLFTYY